MYTELAGRQPLPCFVFEIWEGDRFTHLSVDSVCIGTFKVAGGMAIGTLGHRSRFPDSAIFDTEKQPEEPKRAAVSSAAFPGTSIIPMLTPGSSL